MSTQDAYEDEFDDTEYQNDAEGLLDEVCDERTRVLGPYLI